MMNLIQPIFSTFEKFSSLFLPKHQPVILDDHYATKPLDFQKIYGRSAPLVMEFGTGKGKFIKEYASQNPEMNFFGIEKVNKWTQHSAERIERAKLTNVRLIRSQAELILEKLPPATISEYYILFPDPWPKRRHKPRRLIQPDLIKKIHLTLIPEGKLYIATDHKDYFDWITQIIEPFLDKHFSFVENKKIQFISNFQVKYEKEGRTIYSIHLQKQ